MGVPRIAGLEGVAVSRQAGVIDVVDDIAHNAQPDVFVEPSAAHPNDVPTYENWFRDDAESVDGTEIAPKEDSAEAQDKPQTVSSPIQLLKEVLIDTRPRSRKEYAIVAGMLVCAISAGIAAGNSSGAPTPQASVTKSGSLEQNPASPLSTPSNPFSPEPSPTASKPAELGPVLSPAIFDCSKLAVNMTLSGNAEVGVVANLKNGKKAYVSIPNDIANVAKKNAKTRHPGTSFSGTAGYGVCLPKGTTANTVIVQNGDTLQVDRASFVSLLVLPKNVSADPKAKNREQIDTLIAPISAKAAPTITAASLALINSELAPKGALRKAYVAKVAAEFAAAMGQDVAAKQNKVIASYFDSRLYQILKKANGKFKIVFVNSYAPPTAHQPEADNKKLDNVSLIALDVTAQILKKAPKA